MHIYPRLNFDMERTSIHGNKEPSTGIQGSHSDWIEAQDLLKKKLITTDYFTWKLPKEGCYDELKYVGGVDISFSKDDTSIACGTLVVLDLKSLEVLYEDFTIVRLHVPYIAGFLAFREAPILLELLEKMKCECNPFYPQLLMVDGNGVLHPRGFGLACHLGVQADIPTIGIGKNLHHVDGLIQSRVRDSLKTEENFNNGFIPLIGDSGHTLGAAVKSTECTLKPIYVSIGHRISLTSAIEIVKVTCKYRVPEPVRQADLRSRDYLRKNQLSVLAA